MRFLFVDRITELGDKKIRGIKYFGDSEPLSYGAAAAREIAPSVISEAIGQLLSWLAIKNNDFTARPVFLFADQIEIIRSVQPNSQVELVATIEAMDKESLVFSGAAYVDGNLVHRCSNVNGYFMPLAQLEDPHVTRTRFNQLMTRGMVLEDNDGVFAFDSLVDECQEVIRGEEIVAHKFMRADEPFYRDHFPRYPVTPIVMINEMIAQATRQLIDPKDKRSIRVLNVKNIKIKNFVRPEEACEIRVKMQGRRTEGNKEIIETLAEITKAGKRILRGQYEYSLEGVSG